MLSFFTWAIVICFYGCVFLAGWLVTLLVGGPIGLSAIVGIIAMFVFHLWSGSSLFHERRRLNGYDR